MTAALLTTKMLQYLFMKRQQNKAMSGPLFSRPLHDSGWGTAQNYPLAVRYYQLPAEKLYLDFWRLHFLPEMVWA